METFLHQEVTYPPSHQVRTISWEHHKLITCDVVEGTQNTLYSVLVLAGSLIGEFVILAVVMVIIVIAVATYRRKKRCDLYL